MLPVGQPATILMGVYRCSVKGDAVERQSTFGEKKNTYYELPLFVTNAAGETMDFIWSFGPRNKHYLKFLEIIGGTLTAARQIIPPPSFIGKKFIAKITKRPSRRDKDLLVNEIIEVYPDSGHPVAAEKAVAEPKEVLDDEGNPIPF